MNLPDSPAPSTGGSLHADVSRLEWTFEAEQRRWRGWLRVAPELTLFLLPLEEDRDDRCTLLGGVVPDEAEHRHTRVLVTWAKMAAEWYLNDFEALLKAANAKVSDESPRE